MSAASRRYDLSRTNSICPSPEDLLLESVKKNHTDTIATVFKGNPVEKLLTYEYPFPDEKPILLIACTEPGVKPDTVQVLFDEVVRLRGADIDLCGSYRTLHLANQNPNVEILKVVVENLKPGQINELFDGDNALHSLIKSDAVRDDEEKFVEHVEVLIGAGINVNQGDGRNCSPILLAAKAGLKHIVKAILDKSISHVDLDSHKFRNGKSARDFIKEKQLYNFALPEKTQLPKDPKDALFAFIKDTTNKESEFEAYFTSLEDKLSLINEDDTCSTLLQQSCERGQFRIAKVLIDNGADVNLTTRSNPRPPIELAAEMGYFEIFQALLNDSHIQIETKIVSSLLRNISNPKFVGIDHEKCYEAIMKKMKSDRSLVSINDADDAKNTPIHYAIRYAGQAATKDLLDLDASLAVKNCFDFMPIHDIDPDLLEDHLDNCIKFNVDAKNFDKQDFEVTFNYSSLLPPRPPFEKFQDPEDLKCKSSSVPETEVIAYMSSAPEFKHLLKHPVIVSFLFVKWQRIRWLFYTNLSFYILFVLSLIAYIFTYYGNDFYETPSSACTTIMNISYVTLNITFLVLVLRELFQIAVSPSKYFKNFENLIEIILIFLTAMILFIDSPSNDTRKQLSAMAILLAAFELVLMVGQHPKLSTNVVMLKTVSVNFFKLLLWYSLLIVAFALSFYILFTKSDQVQQNATETDDDGDLFTGPGKSLFKTIVMLTGEFDASSINFQKYPITSKLIFSLFVFMITIILLNLLNGLAVSDTQTIKNDAELVGHIARAQHIWYVESMLLGNILPTSLMNVVQNLCCCLPFEADRSYSFAKLLARKICLFPKGRNCELYVLPNNFGQIDFDVGKKCNKRQHGNCAGICSYTYLDKETVRRTNAIVKAKREKMNVGGGGGSGSSDVSLRLLYEEQAKKLDEILRILSQSKIEIQS